MSDDDTFLVRLKKFEGRSVGPRKRGPDPVNQAMIRHWVEAVGDENPVYVDEEVARTEGFKGVIAPPTMLQAWVMRGFRPAEESPSVQDELMGILNEAGFSSVVATNCEQEYFRPLVLGDWLSVSSVIEEVSAEKQTGLGDGHFVTTRLDFEDENGERVAAMRFRIFKFRPKSKASVVPSDRPRRPRPAITKDNAFFFEGAAEGRLLIQRCSSCGRLRHPPTPACPNCRSFEWDAVDSSGRGTVFSFVVVHHPQVPPFEYPLPIAVVELDEGTRIVADLIEIDPAAVHIGMRVVADFVAVDDELTLPMFKPETPARSENSSGTAQ